MTPPNPQPDKPAVRRFDPNPDWQGQSNVFAMNARADGEYVLFSDYEAAERDIEFLHRQIKQHVAQNIELKAQLTALEAENQELVKEANHDIKALEAERDRLQNQFERASSMLTAHAYQHREQIEALEAENQKLSGVADAARILCIEILSNDERTNWTWRLFHDPSTSPELRTLQDRLAALSNAGEGKEKGK